MKHLRVAKIALAAVLSLTLIAGGVVVFASGHVSKTRIVSYFNNSNGLFKGDEVRILGVPVGEIESIEPQPSRAKITFWIDDKYKVPADAKAAILSPQLITSRAIQLTPVYTDGPVMADGAVIPEDRTAVPVEWDDLRDQLEKLTDALQPIGPGGVSTLGAFVNTAADNVRGQGANIRDTLMKMSQAISALGDHSDDIFSTLKNLSVLVSALQDSTTVLGQLNQNLASVTAVLSDGPDEIGTAIADLNTAVGDVQGFIAENKEPLGVTSDKLASISQALVDSSDDIKQALHVAPTAYQNFVNIYQPAQGALTGALVLNNLANPISFLCGAIQAASRMGAEQSAKLCVQYLAPIVKNRQYNFPPIGVNPFVGAAARPNEVTYSEDWMRPDYVPPAPPSGDTPPPGLNSPQPVGNAPFAAESAHTDPTAGLPGMMIPPGGGS